MATGKTILAVGLEREDYTDLHPILSRSSIEVYRVAMAQNAFELTDEMAFDLILVGQPLPDMRLEDFVAIARRSASASRQAEIVVLAQGESPGELEAVRHEPGMHVLTLESPRLELLRELADHMGLAQRMSQRLLVRLEVQVDDTVETRALQSVNVSATGMLLRTERPYPVETRLTMEFDLPTDGTTVEAEGEVVRHTDPAAEGVPGIGVHFTRLREEDQRRLMRYLESSFAGAV